MARVRVIRVAVAVAVTSLFACASLTGIDQYAIGPCKGGENCDFGEGGANSDHTTPGDDDDGGGPDPGGPACPSDAPGPTMVKVGSAGNAFCIDSTEVTVKQYKQFLAENPTPKNLTAECSWKTAFSADAGASGSDDLPQVYVDWCDAVAYCKWAGKRLCGKIVDGQNPGQGLSQTDLGTAQTDQWYIACSAGGTKRYGYGTSLKPGICNLNPDGLHPKPLKPPGSFPECVAGTAGIFDMIGNVWEWIDYCAPVNETTKPEDYICYARGGSFGAAEANAECNFNGTIAKRSGKNDQVGFRCCAPP